MKIVETVYEFAKPLVEKLNLTIWDVCFEKEGQNLFLRVYLEKNKGLVYLDECEIVSKEISEKLDEIDPIDRPYFLEVSSVGAGRKLVKPEHFEKMNGCLVSLKLFKAFEGKKKFDGILRGFEKSKIKLETDDELLEILLSNCAYVKLKDEDKFELF